jgi:hypothetical protein
MDDKSILDRISELVDEEHALRSRVQSGSISVDEEHQRLKTLEEALDQCWDLLRRRRAARDAGEDPETVSERPLPEVESYLQ